MKDGLIEMDTERGKVIGFTSDKFLKGSYLWLKDGFVYISFIASKAEGNLRQLFQNITSKGYGIKVPNPFPKMEAICKHYGFQKTREYFKEAYEDIDVWIKVA